MQIEMRKPSDLIPYVNNPRKNDGAAVDKVASSIKNFGFKVPIVVDASGEIVAGHTRHKAALKLGLDEVPVVVADDLTPAQIKAFRIADNRVAEESGWDFDLLEIELEAIEGFSVEDLGFDAGELDFGEHVDIQDYSDIENEMELLDGMEDKTITITVPAKYYDEIVSWLCGGHEKTAPGLGKGVMEKCGLL